MAYTISPAKFNSLFDYRGIILLEGVIGTIEMKASANIYIIEYAEAFIFSDISGAFLL